MSGGRFNYDDSRLKNELFGYRDDCIFNPFEDMEISQLMFDLLNLTHYLDWYLSGDTCEETYLEAKEVFKKKWLRNENYKKEVLAKIIEKEFETKKQELLKML